MRVVAAVSVVAGLLAGPVAASALATVSWSVAPATQTEGSAFTVTINRGALDPSTFEVTTGNDANAATPNATPTADYAPGPYSVTFGLAETQKTVTINTVDDSLDEDNENFRIAVKAGTNDYGSQDVTILDNDASPTLTIADATVTEGTGAAPTTISFAVTLSAASARTVTATYSTADQTAIAGQDYTAKTDQTLTIPAGQTTGTITVNVTADDVVEPNETFTVTLGTLTGATLSGTGVATGTIANDDSPPTLRILGPQPTAEGSDGTTTPFEFVIELSRPHSSAVTVGYATNDGSATAPADYSPVEASVTFAPGETRKVVAVPVVADRAIEPNENFSVALSVETAGGIVASVGQATAIIVDDDTPAPPPATPATPVIQPPPGDTTPPRVTLSKITSSRGVMRVTVTCPAGETVCRGTMTVFNVPRRSSKVKSLRREVKFASSLFVLRGGEQARLTMRPSKRAASLIRRAGAVRARGYAVVRDAAGNVATVQTTGTVKKRR